MDNLYSDNLEDKEIFYKQPNTEKERNNNVE